MQHTDVLGWGKGCLRACERRETGVAEAFKQLAREFVYASLQLAASGLVSLCLMCKQPSNPGCPQSHLQRLRAQLRRD